MKKDRDLPELLKMDSYEEMTDSEIASVIEYKAYNQAITIAASHDLDSFQEKFDANRTRMEDVMASAEAKLAKIREEDKKDEQKESD